MNTTTTVRAPRGKGRRKMYNHVEDSGKGDPMFYELTDDEIKLHDEKNQDYRSTSNPVANFGPAFDCTSTCFRRITRNSFQ